MNRIKPLTKINKINRVAQAAGNCSEWKMGTTTCVPANIEVIGYGNFDRTTMVGSIFNHSFSRCDICGKPTEMFLRRVSDDVIVGSRCLKHSCTK